MAEVKGRGGGKGRILYLNNNKIQKYLVKKKKERKVSFESNMVNLRSLNHGVVKLGAPCFFMQNK